MRVSNSRDPGDVSFQEVVHPGSPTETDGATRQQLRETRWNSRKHARPTPLAQVGIVASRGDCMSSRPITRHRGAAPVSRRRAPKRAGTISGAPQANAGPRIFHNLLQARPLKLLIENIFLASSNPSMGKGHSSGEPLVERATPFSRESAFKTWHTRETRADFIRIRRSKTRPAFRSAGTASRRTPLLKRPRRRGRRARLSH